jgi:hypothetical protein
MDRSRLLKRFAFDRFVFARSDFDRANFDRSNLRRAAMPFGTAVSTQKQIQIVFEGTDSSCYLLSSLGAAGIVPSTSRSPN